MGGAVAQVGHEVVGHPVAGDAAEGVVQRTVELRVGELVVPFDGVGHPDDEVAQLVLLAVGRTFGGQAGDEALQCGAHLGDLDRFADADPAHRGAAVGLPLHETLCVELDEGGADRGAAHAVPLGQLQLYQPLTRWEGAAEDVVPQPVGDGCGDDHGPSVSQAGTWAWRIRPGTSPADRMTGYIVNSIVHNTPA